MTSSKSTSPSPPPARPASRMEGVASYHMQSFCQPIDLRLDTNEGPPALPLGKALAIDASTLRHYRESFELDARLAQMLGVAPDRVLATAGGDDAIDRLCRAYLEPGRTLLQHAPTFGMIARSARLAGANVKNVPWRHGAFPIDEFIGAIRENVSIVALITPNNPTGLEIELDDVQRIITRAAEIGALVLVDLAYAEFAEEDPTPELIESPNVVVVRTLSKAWGLAGLRVGYLLGEASLVERCRAAGAPFAISSPSITLALDRLDRETPTDYTTAVQKNRAQLERLLAEIGACPTTPSRANFVLAEFDDASWVLDALAGLGIAVRDFDSPDLRSSLRITCPGNESDFDRLTRGLRSALAPEALLFDLDGVLADVSQSYRQAIARTAAHFGVDLSAEDIARAKREGDANNDWILTHRLIQQCGASGAIPSLDQVTDRFESLYQGNGASPGLRESESLIPARATLETLASRLPLGIVTGRPRADASRFLERHGITDLFKTVICMEEGPAKPDPSVVRRALDDLAVHHAWLVGDTVDDVVAARTAGVIPLAILAPGDDTQLASPALLGAGAARILSSLDDLLELCP